MSYNVATMTDARKIMIEKQIQNDRKLSALYISRAKIRDFNDETRINAYGGYNEEIAMSLANGFSNDDVIDGTINLSFFDKYQITSLEEAFIHCTKLETIDLSMLNLDFCTSFKRAFSGCVNLRTIKFGHQCTMNVQDTSDMFFNCKSLVNIDTGGYAKNQLDWNTSKVDDMSNMFCNCESLTQLQLDTIDTGLIFYANNMFMNCKRLTALRVGNFNMSACVTMAYMFAGCQELKYLDVENWSVDFSPACRFMFYQCESLQYLNLSKWNFSITDMSSMFEGCRCLETLNIYNLDSSDVTNVSNLLYDCESLINMTFPATLLGKNTIRVRMLSNCKKLQSVNIRSPLPADTRELYHNCESLVEINLQDNQLDNVEYMDDMFNGCKSLRVLDLSRQNATPKTMSHCFYNCTNLQVLDISGLNLENTDAAGAFDKLYRLRVILFKEIDGLYYIKDNYLYLAGERFSVFHNYIRKNGILTVTLFEINTF